MGNILRSQGEDPQPTLAHLAENVRSIRTAIGMSQSTLAARSGVSRRMITSIETGGANVSLATVDRLASALEVSFSRLVRRPDAPDSHHIQKLAWKGAASGSEAVLLGAAPAGGEVEMWIWSLGPGETYPSEAGSEGWHEMLYVMSGHLALDLAGGRTVLRPGDFKIFTQSSPYSFSIEGAETVTFLRNVALRGAFRFPVGPGR